jgi:hypothetical protein
LLLLKSRLTSLLSMKLWPLSVQIFSSVFVNSISFNSIQFFLTDWHLSAFYSLPYFQAFCFAQITKKTVTNFVKLTQILFIQRKPLNVITYNVFVCLLWSYWPRMASPKIATNKVLYLWAGDLLIIIWFLLSVSLCSKAIKFSSVLCSYILQI